LIHSFVQPGGAATAAWSLFPSMPSCAAQNPLPQDPLLKEAINRLEYLTPIERAVIFDKGIQRHSRCPAVCKRVEACFYLCPNTVCVKKLSCAVNNKYRRKYHET